VFQLSSITGHKGCDSISEKKLNGVNHHTIKLPPGKIAKILVAIKTAFFNYFCTVISPKYIHPVLIYGKQTNDL
jgi:hypothetical protein